MAAPNPKRDAEQIVKQLAVKNAAIRTAEKRWVESGAHGFRYETKAGLGLGQIVIDKVNVPSAEWAAYDIQQLDDAKTGARLIGHFQGEKQAKQAVEDYWSTIQ